MSRPRLRPRLRSEWVYFVAYAISAPNVAQRIDNGVLALPVPVTQLAEIRLMEKMIRDKSTAVTQGGGAIIGEQGIQVRIISFREIRRE